MFIQSFTRLEKIFHAYLLEVNLHESIGDGCDQQDGVKVLELNGKNY
jgi:hypothetical protein